MRAHVYWVDDVAPFRVGIVPRPRGDDWLDDDLQAVREAGAEVLVSALTVAEERELGLQAEREAAEAVGLRYVSLPVADRGVPNLDARTVEVLSTLRQLMCQGRPLVVHCRMGIGRSSLILALLLGMEGESVQVAFQRVADARGVPVPDTEEQRAWVESAVASLLSGDA